MTDAAISISALVGADTPLTSDSRTCVAPCVQDGQNVQVPAAALSIPCVGVAPPVPLGQFQTWIDQSTSPPTLRMYIERVWTALFTLGQDGALSACAALTLPADPTASPQIATKHYVDIRPGDLGSMVFRGTIDCSGAPNYPAANEGDVYVVANPGKIGGASGVNVGTAAMLLCMVDASLSGTQEAVGAHWAIFQGQNLNLVLNPFSATDASLALFTTSSGLQIQTSGVTLDTSPAMAANSDQRVASQSAVKQSLGGRALSGDTPGQGNLLAWDAVSTSFRTVRGSGRNLLVNSSFDLWEEATSYNFGMSFNSVHVADFWKVGGMGNTGAWRAARRVAGFSGSRFAIQLQRYPGTLDTNGVRLVQQFGREESLFMQGKPLIISFDILIGANFSGAGVTAGLSFGTGIDEYLNLSPIRGQVITFPTGSGTTLPNIQGGNSITPGVYINTLNAQLPSRGSTARIVNQPLTIPANWWYGPVTEMALVIDIGPFSGQAGADDSVTINNVKLEIGNVATPYLRESPEEEYERCQRRYRKSFQRGVAPHTGVGFNTGEHRAPAVRAGTATQSLGTVRFPPMRAVPTMWLYNPYPGNQTNLARDLTAGDCTSTSVQRLTETGFEIVAGGNAATAVGNTLGIHWVADARL
ncbi:MAG TPA: hypothetical protein VFV07_02355 [Rhizomicrobium sp.]|nr:hypothetical protein [Rhizomicrobium sp.]